MTNFPAAPGTFNIGEVITTSIQTLNRGWLKLMGLTVLPWVLGYALAASGVFILAGATIGGDGAVLLSNGAMLHVAIVFVMSGGIGIVYITCQAALVYAVVEQLRGRTYDFGRAFGAGLWRSGRMIGIALVVIVAFVVFIALIMALWAVAARLLVLVLPILLLVGLPMLACTYFVLFPVATVEEHGVIGSFGRSRALTKGYRWPILALVLMLSVGVWIVRKLLFYALQAALPPIIAELIGLVFGVWITTLVSIIGAVAYFRLRYLKDGVGLEEISAVFE